MLTEIWQIDDNGNISYLTCYTLEPKRALIAYKQQKERKNYNTWDYPKDDPDIKCTARGNFAYYKGENTVVYTKSEVAI